MKRKRKVHKVRKRLGWTPFAECGWWSPRPKELRKTWRGVPLENRCKNCLRAKPKR